MCSNAKQECLYNINYFIYINVDLNVTYLKLLSTKLAVTKLHSTYINVSGPVHTAQDMINSLRGLCNNVKECLELIPIITPPGIEMYGFKEVKLVL